MPLFYADASALVKLVRDEPESDALRDFLADADVVSCELVLAELPRALIRAAARDSRLRLGVVFERADAVLRPLALRSLDRALLTTAGGLPEPALRTLDAIHVAAALDVSPIDGFVTYDERQSAAARLASLRTVAPGSGPSL